MNRITLVTMTALLVLAFGACNQVEPETEIRTESFTMPAQNWLDVETFNGSVTIIEGEGPGVIVVATIKQPQQLEYSATVDGDTLKIKATVIDDHTTPSPGVSLQITTPPDPELNLRSSNGRIEVFGVGSGGELATSNGSVTLERVAGLFVVNTSNGRVTLSDVRGSFGVETSNGSIQFDGALEPDTNTQLRTSNGNIDMVVGPNANVVIDAQTSNGNVDVAYPLNNATVDDNKLVGTLGTGSSKLRLRTSNGNINVR